MTGGTVDLPDDFCVFCGRETFKKHDFFISKTNRNTVKLEKIGDETFLAKPSD